MWLDRNSCMVCHLTERTYSAEEVSHWANMFIEGVTLPDGQDTVTATRRHLFEGLTAGTSAIDKYNRYARKLVKIANFCLIPIASGTISFDRRRLHGERIAAAIMFQATKDDYEMSNNTCLFVAQIVHALYKWTGGDLYMARAIFKTLVRPFSGPKSGVSLPDAATFVGAKASSLKPEEFAIDDYTFKANDVYAIEAAPFANTRAALARKPQILRGYTTSGMASILVKALVHEHGVQKSNFTAEKAVKHIVKRVTSGMPAAKVIYKQDRLPFVEFLIFFKTVLANAYVDDKISRYIKTWQPVEIVARDAVLAKFVAQKKYDNAQIDGLGFNKQLWKMYQYYRSGSGKVTTRRAEGELTPEQTAVALDIYSLVARVLQETLKGGSRSKGDDRTVVRRTD